MKKMLLCSIAALVMTSRSSLSEEQTDNSVVQPKNQTEELNAYLSMAQNTEEPKQASDEMSSKGNIKNRLNLSIPATDFSQMIRAGGIPAVGDTIQTEKGVRVIIKSITNYTTIGILVEKVYTDETDAVEPNKTLSGLGWWEGSLTYDLLTQKTTATEITRWGYTGIEHRDWSGKIYEDSLFYEVTYSDPSVESLTPGNSRLWTKVLLTPKGIGVGDTARITVDSLDGEKHIQYGEGTLFSKGLGRTFNFDFELIHRNELNPDSPYENYRYNQSIVRYAIPMVSEKVDFKTLNAAIFYHVDRDDNGTADLYERNVLLTTETGDTVVYAEGNVATGNWEIVKKNTTYFK